MFKTMRCGRSFDELGLKGSVQRKLRWVLIGANHWVMVWDCGAGQLNIFPIPVTTAKLIGEFYNNR
jgi:hypothetical protein